MRLSSPNYTQVPNDFLDQWLPDLGLAETKVLLVIFRKTFGWHKVRDRISLSQLEKSTGLEKRHILKATKSLVEKNIILKNVEGKNGEQQTFYELILDEDSNNFNQCPKDTPPSVPRTPTKERPTKEMKENNKKKSPSATPITLNSETKKFEGISEEDIKRWQNTFPAVNVRKEIHEALLWALNSPRKNYRRSLDIWMRNINQKHTTAYEEPEKISVPATEQEKLSNKKMGDCWEEQYAKNPQPHYDIQSSSFEVTFIMPNNGTYSVKYDIRPKEFFNQCLTAIKRMKLLTPQFQ